MRPKTGNEWLVICSILIDGVTVGYNNDQLAVGYIVGYDVLVEAYDQLFYCSERTV